MNFIDNFKEGLKRGITIALGYIPTAITFGLIASSQAVPAQISILMSALVYAGASQFVALNLIKLDTGILSIILTTFIVNLRHFLMTAALGQRIKDKVDHKWMPLLAFGITDESFSLISLTDNDSLSFGFILGINLIGYLAWVIGTIFGVYLGNVLPEIIQVSMKIALYAMFIGLLVPSMKRSKPVLFVAVLALLISALLNWGPAFLTSLAQGWKIIIITIISSTAGACYFRNEEHSCNE
jgi:4-azaleucine resistance transporter AzlC